MERAAGTLEDHGWLKDHIREVPDFPRAGVSFKDLTPLLGHAQAFSSAVRALAAPFETAGITRVVGIEARGFIVAAPVALALGAGFVPAGKAGKLPWTTQTASYDLEYGTDHIEIHEDALDPGDRVLIVDDVIATGGTASAAVELVTRLRATVVGLSFLVELGFLDGRRRLLERTGTTTAAVHTLVAYE